MRNAEYTWVEGALTTICMQNTAVDLLHVLFVSSDFVEYFYRKLHIEGMEFGIEVCWFYCPVCHLETVPQQKALVRTRNPKADNNYRMWFNDYSIFHITVILIFENFDKLLCLRSRIPFSTLLDSKNPVFYYWYSFVCMPFCIHDYLLKKLYYFTHLIISKSRTV